LTTHSGPTNRDGRTAALRRQGLHLRRHEAGHQPVLRQRGILTIAANPLSEEHRKLLAPLEKKDKKIKSVLYSSGMLSTETQLRKPGQGFHQLYG
jgi:hypothetical protein